MLLVSLAELHKMTKKAKVSFWRQSERMTQLQVGCGVGRVKVWAIRVHSQCKYQADA